MTGRKRRTVEKDNTGIKSLKKWLRASRRRQARMKMPRRPHKEQSTKVTARKSNTKKRKQRRTGKKKHQMEVQWTEDERVENILERRRMEGGSLQAEVVQKVPELVVHERMLQGEKAGGTRERMKVQGCSTEEM